MSAVATERRGSFLNEDLDPKVAASLDEKVSVCPGQALKHVPKETKATVASGQKISSEEHSVSML